MNTVILIRYGEIGLKGQNRRQFEKALMTNIQTATGIEPSAITAHHGRMYIHLQQGLSNFDAPQLHHYRQALSRVFGLVGYALAYRLPLTEDLHTLQTAIDQLIDQSALRSDRTFKIDARRSYRSYGFTSAQLNERLGSYVGERHQNWRVDLEHPDFICHIEVRQEGIFLYTNRHHDSGPGGLPVGVSGKGLLLLSGGIDSPVAGWLMLKRGMQVDPMYFHSPPYTGDKVKEKVLDLANVLVHWKQTPMTLYIPYFTPVQVEINKRCPEPTWTVLHRRYMMRIAEQIAKNPHFAARKPYQTLITGENLSQVASQTIENIHIINRTVQMPIFRPLIGYDKQEIVELSQAIDTFRISKIPHVDCCSLFAPRRPSTKARLDVIEKAEAQLDSASLIEEALAHMEMIQLEA